MENKVRYEVGNYVKVLTNKFKGVGSVPSIPHGTVIEVCEECHSKNLGVWIDNESCEVYELNDWAETYPEDFELVENLLESNEHVAVAKGSKEETDKSLGLIENDQYTGSSSDYYKVFVNNPTTLPEPYFAECNDLIEALQMTFAEGNAFKAIWRKAKARQGVKKKGYDNGVYDSEKVVFFGERMLVQAKENA